MSLSSITGENEKIFLLAREQLAVSALNTQRIPDHYITELQRHIKNHPFDTNFRVQLQPGKGFGLMRCLEDSCLGTIIALNKRSNTSVPDGGIACGFGSLSAYRQHVLESKPHQMARDKRIRVKSNALVGKFATSKPRIKPEPNLPSISAPPQRFKREISDTMLIRKRPSTEPELAMDLKRVKLENSLSENPGSFNDMTNVKVQDVTAFTDANIADTKPTISSADIHTPSKPGRSLARPSLPLPRRVSVKPETFEMGLSTTGRSSKLRYSGSLSDSSDVKEFHVPGDTQESRYKLEYNDGRVIATSDENSNPMTIVNKFVAQGMVPYVAPAHNANSYDEDGNFYGRGKDTFVGPQAAPSDFNAFVKMAASKEQFDQNSSVDRSLAMLGLNNKEEMLEGMTIRLMDHQIIGVAWMVAKEKTSMKGGILGDDMGLGKTVQMIATMVKNRSDDPICKTNLILAPMALLEQWKLEIESKSNCGLKCLIYHGNAKAKIKKPKDLLKYDVVLTTYSTMALEWPDYEAEMKSKAKSKRRKSNDGFLTSDSEEDIKPAKKQSKKKTRGLLFQTEFLRIILDEAHNIRNKTTRASRAASDLIGKHRWALTGTIIINTIVDVYGCFRFVRIRPWHDWAEFNEHIGLIEKKRPDLAATRLQAILAMCHLRRLKTTVMNGKPLIQLPPKHVELTKLKFTAEERSVYDMVERKSQATFNRFLRAGTVLKNYHHVLVMLLRLRQICSHASLIQEEGKAFIEPDQVNDDHVQADLREDIARARHLVSAEFVQKLREKFKVSALNLMKAEKEHDDEVILAKDSILDEDCPLCFDLFTDPVVTPCTHVFCRGCIEKIIEAPQNEEQAGDTIQRYAAHERPCPFCRSPICKEKLFRRAAFEPTEADLRSQHIETEDDDDAEVVTEMIVATNSSRRKKKVFSIETDDEEGDEDFEEKASSPPASSPPPPRRSTRTRRASQPSVNTDDEEETGYGDDVDMPEDEEDEYTTNDDEMDDFIVADGSEFAPRPTKKKLGKRRAMAIYDSDDEDILEGKEQVLFGLKKKTKKLTPEQVKLMPRFLPSTKMKHMMETLLQLQKDKPQEKTIVVSQWTGCLKLVSDYLTEHCIPHVKYQGDMSLKKRNEAVVCFMANDKARVMLMSLKCGGVGLNLTRANNLITLDLAWSQAIESQAFDRIHRMGQCREVTVNRLVIENTVEDRILALQERKQNIADGSLGEGGGKKIGRLTVTELASLFGLNGRGDVI